MKKIKVGKKAILFKTDQTKKQYGYHSDMGKIGDDLKVVEIDGEWVKAEVVKSSKSITYSYHIGDLKRTKKTKTPKEAKDKSVQISPKFELNDIVRVINLTGGSINSIGDIGVVTELNGVTDVRVTVPGKDNESNWSNVEDVETLGLVGSIK